MTDSEGTLDAIAHAASELVPELSERLRRYGLGEIEIARGDLRLRVSATAPNPAASDAGMPSTSAAASLQAQMGADGSAPEPAPTAVGVTSPAVGFFVYADGLGPGLEVRKGDALGHVEMLGVRHDVRAPRAGTVAHLVAETGEAVEYGQLVVELESAGRAR